MKPRDPDNPAVPFDPAAANSPANRLRMETVEVGSYQQVVVPENPQGATPSGPPALSVLSLVGAFQRRWMLALCLAVLVAMAGAAAAWALVPNKYYAYSTLQIAMQQKSIFNRANERNDFDVFMKTQAARIKSRDVLLGALKQEPVRNLETIKQFPDTLSALTWLEDDMKIDFQDRNELLTLTVSGDRPEELVVLVNALTNSYLGIINGKELSERKEKVKRVEKFADSIRERIKDNINTRQGLYKGQGVPDLTTMTAQQQNILGQLVKAQEETFRLQFDEEKIKSKVAAIKAMRKDPTEDDLPDAVLKSYVEADPEMKQKLITQLNVQKIIDKMIDAGHPPTDPSLRKMKDTYARIKGEVDKYRKELRADLLDRMKKKAEADQKSLVESSQAELVPLGNHIKKVAERVAVLTKEYENLGYSTVKIDLLTLEIQQDQKKFDALQEQLKNFQLEEEAEPRVALAQDAVWQVKDAKRRMLIIMLVPVLLGSLMCVGVAWFEYRAGKIQSPEEVASQTGMRILGTTPVFPKAGKSQRQATAANDPSGALVESIDNIRTVLLRGGNAGKRVVMVTSAAAGEGKTTLATNLALSLAQAGRKTLLIDCDFRNPRLHLAFEQTQHPGVCEVLVEEVELDQAVRPTTTDENLWLLPAGQWDRDVLQELTNNRFHFLTEKLKDQFEYLVIDTHPILAATDTLLVGQCADAVILSLMRNVSRSAQLAGAREKLAALNIDVFGAVVNSMPAANAMSMSA